MGNMIKYIFFLLFLLPTVIVKSANLDFGTVIIEGVVVDTCNAPIEVEVAISTFASNDLTTKFERITQFTDNNKKFRFSIQSPAKRFYMRIKFSPNGSTYIDNVYILEDGDHIKATLSKYKFLFEGKGATKLQCQDNLYRCRYVADDSEAKWLSAKSWTERFQYLAKKQDSVLNLRLQIVKYFEPLLDKDLANILKANCIGLRYFTWFRTAQTTSEDTERFTAFVRNASFLMPDRSLESYISEEVLVASPNYVDFLYEKLATEDLWRKIEQGLPLRDNPNWLFDKIKTEYKGLIRDKLITIFILRHQRADLNLNNYLNEALKIIKQPQYLSILNKIKLKIQKDVLFFPFKMEDEKGSKWTLADFEGKLLLVDFWFTGCGPCKELNKAMQPIIKRFRDNPKVVFITVNNDRNKKYWFRSIVSGEYTHKETINLYGGTEQSYGCNGQELLKTYDITSFPKIMLIRDRKVLEVNVQKPSIQNFRTAKALIQTMENALKDL